MNKIRVGSVNYLNTKPLEYGLKKPPIIERIKLIEDYPARLADMLIQNKIDVGLVPVAAIPALPEYHIVGDYCIGADGEVASVCLFSEVPVEKIEKIYLDYQSRTSVALLKWLIKKSWNHQPEFMEAKDEQYINEIKGATAGLVIGNRALVQRKISPYIYDLGLAWKKVTGLPFVFAAWVSMKKLPGDFISLFNNANALGLEHLDEIVAATPFDIYDLKEYYTNHISYVLDENKRKAMQKFLEFIK